MLIFVFCEQFSIMRQPILLHVDKLIPLAKDFSYPRSLIPKISYSNNPVGVKSFS